MERRERFYAWLAFGLTALWMSIGCTPGSLSMMLLPFTNDKIEPKCKLASKDKKKEVTVVIVCNQTVSVTKPDLIAVDQDLADKLTQAMNKNFKENKEKVKIVSPSKVRAYQNKMTPLGVLADQDIGSHFKADFVISIDINSMDLYAERSSQLFRGKIDLAVRTLDLSKPKGDGQEIFEEFYSLTYPTGGPLDASGSSPIQFRAAFLGRVARDLSRWFTPSPPETVRDMD